MNQNSPLIYGFMTAALLMVGCSDEENSTADSAELIAVTQAGKLKDCNRYTENLIKNIETRRDTPPKSKVGVQNVNGTQQSTICDFSQLKKDCESAIGLVLPFSITFAGKIKNGCSDFAESFLNRCRVVLFQNPAIQIQQTVASAFQKECRLAAGEKPNSPATNNATNSAATTWSVNKQISKLIMINSGDVIAIANNHKDSSSQIEIVGKDISLSFKKTVHDAHANPNKQSNIAFAVVFGDGEVKFFGEDLAIIKEAKTLAKANRYSRFDVQFNDNNQLLYANLNLSTVKAEIILYDYKKNEIDKTINIDPQNQFDFLLEDRQIFAYTKSTQEGKIEVFSANKDTTDKAIDTFKPGIVQHILFTTANGDILNTFNGLDDNGYPILVKINLSGSEKGQTTEETIFERFDIFWTNQTTKSIAYSKNEKNRSQVDALHLKNLETQATGSIPFSLLIQGVAFSPDGQHIAVAIGENYVTKQIHVVKNPVLRK